STLRIFRRIGKHELLCCRVFIKARRALIFRGVFMSEADRAATLAAPDVRLADLAAQALARPGTQPAVEYGQRWIDWGAMCRVARDLGDALDAHGIGPGGPVAFVPRNRPVALAALLG